MPKVSQAHRDARREQILDAAKRCFLRDGFHETSMQDLFAESGLSAGAVYRYFPGKTDMIRAIALENIAEVVDVVHTLATRTARRQPRQRPRRGVAGRRRQARRGGPGRDRGACVGEALRNRELAEWIAGEIARMRTDLAEIVREHQAAGTLPADVDPMAIAGLVMSIVPGFILQLAVLRRVERRGRRRRGAGPVPLNCCCARPRLGSTLCAGTICSPTSRPRPMPSMSPSGRPRSASAPASSSAGSACSSGLPRRGSTIRGQVLGGATFAGVVARVGPDWLLMDEGGRARGVLALAALASVSGLGAARPSRAAVARCWPGWDCAARCAASPATAPSVRLHLRDGVTLDATIDRVGADFVEVARHAPGEPRRRSEVRDVVLVPLDAVAVVSRRAG